MFVGWVSGTGRAGCGHLWRWERMGSIAKEGVEQGLGPGQEEVEQDGQSCPPGVCGSDAQGLWKRGRFQEAVPALELRSRFTHIFYRL